MLRARACDFSRLCRGEMCAVLSVVDGWEKLEGGCQAEALVKNYFSSEKNSLECAERSAIDS